VLLHGVKVCAWCDKCKQDYWTYFFFRDINSHWYVTHSDTFCNLSNYERTYTLLKQNGATAHTEDNSTHHLENAFGNKNNKQGILASSFTRSKPMWFFTVDMLKDNVYSNNLHTEDNMRSIQGVVFLVSPAELQFCNEQWVRYVVCLQANRTTTTTTILIGQWLDHIREAC
jgi:hypothetical protein